jgi:hypothetical protein
VPSRRRPAAPSGRPAASPPGPRRGTTARRSRPRIARRRRTDSRGHGPAERRRAPGRQPGDAPGARGTRGAREAPPRGRARRAESPRRFAYYDRLTRVQQRVYRQSDAITALRLPGATDVRPLVPSLEEALRSEERLRVQAASQVLFTALTRAFDIGPCRLEVLAARPHGRWGELQGLYTEDPRGRAPRVQLWMRTARQRRVVAFRTYLRTLLHELCHHLDYRYLRLADSFHTQGFYQRESSLFHQLVPDATAARGPAGDPPGDDVPF